MELFKEYPVLESDRLIIRKMTEDDAEALTELTARDKVYSTLPSFLYELKYDDKREVIKNLDRDCFETEESLILGVFLKDGASAEQSAVTKAENNGPVNQKEHDNECSLVGIAEIYNYEEKKEKASIGYRLSDRVWGQGIGTEAAKMLRDYLIKNIGLRTVTAHVLNSNIASAAVLENNGFIAKYQNLYEDWGREGLELTDKYVFKSEWKTSAGGDAASAGVKPGSMEPVQVERFVMAYKVEQDRLRAMLPAGYRSLRPVLRINTEIRDDKILYIEFNTPVEADGRRGWLNIDNWKSSNDPGMEFRRNGDEVCISTPFLQLSYYGTGAYGGCPAEQDNEGCYYIGNDIEFRPAEIIEEREEYCCCKFSWSFSDDDAHGESDGSMLPAKFTMMQHQYESVPFTAENAAAIRCRQVLGAYVVRFKREYE